jgi:hypothetical protein
MSYTGLLLPFRLLITLVWLCRLTGVRVMMIVPTAGSCGVAKERMESKDEMTCYDWFFCTKKLSQDKAMAEIRKK